MPSQKNSGNITDISCTFANTNVNVDLEMPLSPADPSQAPQEPQPAPTFASNVSPPPHIELYGNLQLN